MRSRKTRSTASRWFVASAALVLAVATATGCSSTRSTGGQIDDATITSTIKTKLAGDPQVNPFEIDVDTNEGVVRLNGMVESREARAEAEKLARATDGVHRVENDIEIGDQTLGEQVDDGWIGTKVKSRLAADDSINPFDIDVDVQSGVVVLSGRVETDSDRELAESIAQRVKGVKRVDNRLKVGEVDR